jgi:hypothetical protein
MGWLTTLFSPFTLNPAVAAAGAGLVAAPILIHLINRMRYRKVKFAAMEFLLASQQKNRRRVLIEQLLLLLLRVLIVVGMILLLARLVLDPSALALIRAGAKTHHVVLLDDSGSMRSRTGGATAFDAAKDVVRNLVSGAARESDSQMLTLILLSGAKRNEAFFTEREINEEFLNELDAKLENVTCTHQALDLADGLEAARQRLAPEQAGGRLLHVLSDFRRSDWTDQPGLLNGVTDLGKSGVAVNLVRVVGDETPNLAVTSVSGDLGTAAAGVPVRLRVGVTNFGATVAENVTVGVTQDKLKLPIAERLAKVEPGTEVFTEFDVAFQTPGRHALRVELGGDALAADDQRYSAVDVAPSHPVLVIDGTPGQGDGPGLLADALAPVPGLSGVAPRIESVDFLRRSPLREFRAIVLVNVPSLPPDALRALEGYVRSGGGLAWFLGDAVQPAYYNTQLYAGGEDQPPGDAKKSAAGLFPVPLAPAKITRERNPESQSLDIEFRTVGRFTPFARGLAKYWHGLHVANLIPPAEGWERNDDRRADGVTTVASLKGGEPLILEHRFGEGRVVTVLTSAGQDWTNWPRQAMYVPFMLELFKEIASRPEQAESRVSGTPLTFDLPAAEYDPDIRIERPDGSPASLRATPRQVGPKTDGAKIDGEEPELRLQAVYADTDEPGIYKVLLTPASGGALQETWYAVNAPLSESRLRLADPAAIRKQIAGASNVTLRDPGDSGWLRVRETGREARLALVVALIALLVVEQALAYRLSYHPKAPARAI